VADTLGRGHTRLSADGIAVPYGKFEYDAVIAGHERLTVDELENRWCHLEDPLATTGMRVAIRSNEPRVVVSGR
jgi:hypothetical protein